MIRRVVIALLSLLVLALGARIVQQRPRAARAGSVVKTVTFRGARFDVVELPLDAWALRVDLADAGVRLSQVAGAVRTNAGIFEPGFTPTGLLVRDGVALRPLSTSEGAGNFYLLPNGVFSLGADGARVVETSEYSPQGVQFATQSGPLLVRRGALHPAFKQTSENRALRSGVGVRDARHVVLVISRDDVNLWTFAALFRDELGCADALYLDGVISALWAEGAGRDADLEKGPFAGVITATPRR